MKSCIFCDIANHLKQGHFLYEDEKVMAILDIFPSTPGHAMVIPKKHGETILDYTEKELGYTMEVVKKVINGLTIAFNTKVFTIGINHAEKLGVPHLHIHILPRYENDQGKIIQDVVKKPSSDKLELVADRIKKILDKGGATDSLQQ